MDIDQHPLRSEAIGEVHARPFDPVPIPARILHYGFDTKDDQARAVAFHQALAGVAGNDGEEGALRLTRFEIDAVALRWEQHTEFATLTAIMPLGHGQPSTELLPAAVRALMASPPGPLLVATEIQVVSAPPPGPSRFDEASLCEADVLEGAARIQSDFRLALGGYTRSLLIARRLPPRQVGVLARQLLEIETYRTFAMLGLPVARRLTPILSAIEKELAEATNAMLTPSELKSNHALLERLTAQAAKLESEAAATSFRFGATNAYREILFDRLGALREEPVEGRPTLTAFLNRRVSPAIRTCTAVTERIAELSRRLTRAANLLRTRVDIELEAQNQSVLRSMDRRAKLQLRLQQTVEGLSVAAVSYYVVGLVGYVAKGGKALGLPLNAEVVAALAVPIVMLIIWRLVRHIRHHHSE